MIILSPSLIRRLHRETERHLGSEAQLAFYDGLMPNNCDGTAQGNKLMTLTPLPDRLLNDIVAGIEPLLPEGATYWRIYDNGGLVAMQGDSS